MQNTTQFAAWLTALKAEVEEFARSKPGLMPKYAGRYVAIYGGEVIGSDEDEFALLRHIHQQCGPIPCCIDHVVLFSSRRISCTTFALNWGE